MFTIDVMSRVPVYEQLIKQVEDQVLKGIMKEGDKMPSVRSLSMELLNLVLRDSSIILSGTAGLLYIMFLSGLDMDMSDFKKNSWRSLIFGLYTFCVPLGLGILAGYYILGFPIYSSILLAGLLQNYSQKWNKAMRYG